MITAYSIACQHGFPYIRGEAKTIDGKVYTRHTKRTSGKGPSLYVHVSDKEVHVLKGEETPNPGTNFREE